jgi:iron complex transport system substrate-binding protein
MVRRGIAAGFAALTLLGAACAQQPESSQRLEADQSREGAFPVTVEAGNGTVRIAERPESIISLSATATEMLFAVGAGEQVEAVDDTSNYPPEAPTSELSAYEPNVEAIAAYDPDLVVISDDINDLLASLEALEIPVLLEPAATTLGDTYDQIEDLGLATGHPTEARAAVTEITLAIEEIVADVPVNGTAPTYYHELDPTYYTATSQTFIGELYGLLGLESIADEADPEGTGYPQLSAEYILDADPDFIFLADTECCDQSLQTVSKRAGWEQLTAVEQGNVIELDDDIASRWGPRVVDFLEIVSGAIAAPGA